jgi:glycosyltransferase involved in cell wall biosynthesis
MKSAPPTRDRPSLSTGPAVIIGVPQSVFVQELAADWRRRGLDVIVVTSGHWKGDERLPCGSTVIAADRAAAPAIRRELSAIAPILTLLDQEMQSAFASRAAEALADWDPGAACPSTAAPLHDALAISAVVASLAPRFVIGLEVFAHGVATALCRGTPRILMPWGGDIYLFAETNPLAFAMTQYALQSVDLIWCCSVTARRRLVDRFGAPAARIRTASWGVDVARFAPAEVDERDRIRTWLGVPPGRRVVMMARRFRPPWGSAAALEAFLQVAAARPDTHFLIAGGAGGETRIRDAAARVAAEGLSGRFTCIDSDLSLEDWRRCLSIADVTVNLMRTSDLRSAGLMQAAAAGGAPVLSDQPEYRQMAREGFHALFAGADDVGGAVEAIVRYLDDAPLRQATVAANRSFLAAHEDHETRMRQLLDWIGELAPSPTAWTPALQLDR